MMNRPLIVLTLVLAAATTQAQARSPIGGATMARAPLQADPLGPRSDPTPTVREAVARVQIEKNGYTSLRRLSRNADGTWRAKARNAGNTPGAVALENQGKDLESR